MYLASYLFDPVYYLFGIVIRTFIVAQLIRLFGNIRQIWRYVVKELRLE